MSGHSSGLTVMCRRLAFCGRHDGVDTSRAHTPGANEKPRHAAAGVVFIDQAASL